MPEKSVRKLASFRHRGLGPNWLRSAIPAEAPISGSFRNHAYVNVAAGPAPGGIGFVLQFQPKAPYWVRFATTPMSMWRRAGSGAGIGFVLQFQPKAPYWVRFATTPTSMRLRTRIGFVPPKAAGTRDAFLAAALPLRKRNAV